MSGNIEKMYHGVPLGNFFSYSNSSGASKRYMEVAGKCEGGLEVANVYDRDIEVVFENMHHGVAQVI